jgi:hypothetical protein
VGATRGRVDAPCTASPNAPSMPPDETLSRAACWECVATLRIHSACVLITHTVHTLTLHDTSLTTQHTHHSPHAPHAPQSPCHDHEFKSTGGSHCADELTLQAKVRDAARGRALPRNIYHSLPCVTRTLHARTNMLHTSRPLNETTLHACARTHTLAR